VLEFEPQGEYRPSYLANLAGDLRTIGEKEHLECILLFGSVARGDATPDSDIDIIIVLPTANADLERKIGDQILDLEQKYDVPIQVLFDSPAFARLDRVLLEAALREGMVLYGSVPPISVQRLALEPYAILSFDLRALPHSQKMAVKRELYGQVTTKRLLGKEYRSEHLGLVQQVGAERISSGGLLIPEGGIAAIESYLLSVGAHVKIVHAWISKR
jgi:predicted nucleotidyltransferase